MGLFSFLFAFTSLLLGGSDLELVQQPSSQFVHLWKVNGLFLEIPTSSFLFSIR